MGPAVGHHFGAGPGVIGTKTFGLTGGLATGMCGGAFGSLDKISFLSGYRGTLEYEHLPK